MSPLRPRALAVGAAALLAAAVGHLVHSFTPPPVAGVSRGSEEAFGSGLLDRELPAGHDPLRWTTERSVFRFRSLPPGPLNVQVRVAGQKHPVYVLVDGREVGAIPVGRFVGRFPLAAGAGKGGRLTVELRTEGFVGRDGRLRGALLDYVRVAHGAPAGPNLRVVADFALPAVALALCGLGAGLSPIAAGLLAAAAALVQAVALVPHGLVRSPYGAQLPLLAAGAGIVALAVARLAARRFAGAGPACFAAVLLAVVIQGLAANSPMMIASDVVFHANKLRGVAAGDLFPVSVTQHARPFTIPYGVAFYALLAPLARAGYDPVALVRLGASMSGVLASIAVFFLVAPRGVRRATLATALLQLLPGTFDHYSYANLSNVFAQSMTVAWFAWWAGGTPGGWALGGLLLALASLGHLSALILCAVLAAALIVARRTEGAVERTRLLALALGFGGAAAYYAGFAGLILEQLPRLLEGGGLGRGASHGAGGALAQQLAGALGQWAPPALLLALAARPWRPRDALERDSLAYALGALLLAVPAVLTPLDVRYIYALTLPVAIFGAAGVDALAARGHAGRLLGWLLLGAQALLGAANVGQAVAFRYRP